MSAITDQAGMQEAGVNLADLDDDEGNGLVSRLIHSLSFLSFCIMCTFIAASLQFPRPLDSFLLLISNL